MYFSLKHFMKGPLCNSKSRYKYLHITNSKNQRRAIIIIIIVLTSLVGKTVIITGGTSGLGLETAKELSLRGARIILVCRSRVNI